MKFFSFNYFQIERKNYKCVSTVIFSIILAFAVTVPTVFETEIEEMSREAIEENIFALNITIRLSEDNLVLLHTDMYHHKTYKDMFRMLFNFLTSQVPDNLTIHARYILLLLVQVAVVWILPVMFLHSRNVYTINKKMLNPHDLLIPIISLFFIIFSLPQLALFMIHILLYQTPDLLVRLSGLSLAGLASFKVVFYLIFDRNLRRDLSISNICRSRIAVPRDEY